MDVFRQMMATNFFAALHESSYPQHALSHRSRRGAVDDL
jgi:hypothetical protein